MSHHLPHEPVLYIDGTKVSFSRIKLSKEVGKSEGLNAVLSDPDLEDMALINKKVEFYLNKGYGSPLFRGYINTFTPSERQLTIRAQDVTSLLSGNLAPIVMDDNDNYDGYTAVQFLKEYIESQVNVNETLISTQTLHEMDRPVYMTGMRGIINPFKKIQKLISKKVDDESSLDRADINSIFKYFIDVINLGDASGITIRKTRSLNDNADFVFSNYDGIQSLSYRERPPPSYAMGNTDGNNDKKEQVVLQYGNAPTGVRGMVALVEGSSRGEIREKMISHLILAQEEIKEISLIVSKGYEIGLGNIIHIEVPENNIAGKYRVTGKKMTLSGNKMKCSIECNNEPITLEDYL